MKLRLNIDGKTYEVDVEVFDDNALRGGGAVRTAVQSSSAVAVGAAAAAATPAPAAEPIDESKALRCPISGVVVRVEIEAGQTVKENDTVMVVEAMKMETVINSPRDGKIAKINAKAGDAVQVKQVLVEYE